MKRSLDWYQVVVLLLGLIVAAVVGLLMLSVVRQSALDQQLETSVNELLDTTDELQETVEMLRANADDAAIATSLETVDERLEAVDEQLELLQENIDEPLFAVEAEEIPDGAIDPATQEIIEVIEDEFDRTMTIVAWFVGLLSILTAVTLTIVLRLRWQQRKHRLLPPTPSSTQPTSHL